MIKEVLCEWNTQSGGGKLSVFYFNESATITAQRAALGTFLGAVDGSLDSNTTWFLHTQGRILDEATGTLTGEWLQNTPISGVGAAAGECVADATQVLFQWRTGVVVNGRFLRGRTFIPSLASTQVIGGNLSTAQVVGLTTAGTTFVTSGVGFGIWHRPSSGSGGQFVPATACTVWNELAVLRRRRG